MKSKKTFINNYLTLLFIVFTILFEFNLSDITVNATNQNKIVSEIGFFDTQPIPYSERIVFKYRIYNNKRQYRRWNITRSCWVDDNWIDV